MSVNKESNKNMGHNEGGYVSVDRIDLSQDRAHLCDLVNGVPEGGGISLNN
jgi:hypothetical protein